MLRTFDLFFLHLAGQMHGRKNVIAVMQCTDWTMMYSVARCRDAAGKKFAY